MKPCAFFRNLISGKIDTTWQRVQPLQYAHSGIYRILEGPPNTTRWRRPISTGLFFLISANVISAMMTTIPTLPAAALRILHGFERISIWIFTIEYAARMWCITADPAYTHPLFGRIRHLLRPIILIDLLSLLPFFLPIFGYADLRFIRALRLFRTLRILRIGRFSDALASMSRIFRRRRDELLITAFTLLVAMIFTASLVFYAEQAAQPGVFKSIFSALYWSIITLTTTGYGDITPVTILGRAAAGLTALIGIGFVAIPSGILGSAFVEDFEFRNRGKVVRNIMSGHIILCGFSRSANYVINSLLQNHPDLWDSIILITRSREIEIDKVKFVKEDYSNIDVLINNSIEYAKACVVFSEVHKGESLDLCDMRTMFTVQSVKTRFPDIHVIAELNDAKSALHFDPTGHPDEFIYRDIITAGLMMGCLTIPGISRTLYEVLDHDNARVFGADTRSMGLFDPLTTYYDVLEYGVNHGITFIGCIKNETSKSFLSPPPDMPVLPDDILLYLSRNKRL